MKNLKVDYWETLRNGIAIKYKAYHYYKFSDKSYNHAIYNILFFTLRN